MIFTERLHLRLFEESDAAVVSKCCSDENIYKTTFSMPNPYTEEIALKWIKSTKNNFIKGLRVDLAITEQKSNKLIGYVGFNLHKFDNNAELSYWIDKTVWNRGYATESAKALIDYGFNKLGLHKIYARSFSFNLASEKVLMKLGMNFEGELRQQYLKNETYQNVSFFGLLKSEWHEDQKK